MSCGILGCSSEKRYKTTLPDLELYISRKEICLLYLALSLGIESNCFFLPLLKFCSLWKLFYFLLSRRGNEYEPVFISEVILTDVADFCGICLKPREGIKYKVIFGGFSQLLELFFEVVNVGH